MRIKIIVLLFISSTICINTFGITLTLKNNADFYDGKIYIKDVVVEKAPQEIGDILLIETDKTELKLTPIEIINVLYNNGIKGVKISGAFVILKDFASYTPDQTTDIAQTPPPTTLLLKPIRDHIYSFIDKNRFKLELFIIDTIPTIDENGNYENIRWELPIIKDGIKDIDKFRNLTVFLDNTPVKIRLDLRVYSNVFISKEKIKKDDLFIKEKFAIKYCDITTISNYENLLYDLNDKANFIFKESVGIGTILRADQIMKMPDAIKGENVTVKLSYNDIILSISGQILEDGHFGKIVNVKTATGKKLTGILRKTNEGKIVEVN